MRIEVLGLNTMMLATEVFLTVMELGIFFSQKSKQDKPVKKSVKPDYMSVKDVFDKIEKTDEFDTLPKIEFLQNQTDTQYYLNGITTIGAFSGAPDRESPYWISRQFEPRSYDNVWFNVNDVGPILVIRKSPAFDQYGFSNSEQLGFTPYMRGTGGRFVGVVVTENSTQVCQHKHLEAGQCNGLAWYYKKDVTDLLEKTQKNCIDADNILVSFKDPDQPFKFEDKWRFEYSRHGAIYKTRMAYYVASLLAAGCGIITPVLGLRGGMLYDSAYWFLMYGALLNTAVPQYLLPTMTGRWYK